jgi:hypothetical protein
LVYPKLLELVKTGNDLIQVSNVSWFHDSFPKPLKK